MPGIPLSSVLHVGDVLTSVPALLWRFLAECVAELSRLFLLDLVLAAFVVGAVATFPAASGACGVRLWRLLLLPVPWMAGAVVGGSCAVDPFHPHRHACGPWIAVALPAATLAVAATSVAVVVSLRGARRFAVLCAAVNLYPACMSGVIATMQVTGVRL